MEIHVESPAGCNGPGHLDSKPFVDRLSVFLIAPIGLLHHGKKDFPTAMIQQACVNQAVDP